ncbi:MAG: succinylglutamate desuccinylase/aspartoacylase family protein [Planctomycetes bacterium]|nr:succinylglutamate desuccinylase/aspartoacylase family protein [Planctomycetota bacterium]
MTVELRQFEYRSEVCGPTLLITGGVHGDEFEPMAAIRRLIDLFEAQARDVSGFRGRVILVPVVNEAAFVRGHRCADDGLDLARTCPGRPDGSITEQTAWALSEFIRRADFYIDLHTGGTELSVYPLAGYVMHANPAVLDAQRRMARAFNLPIVWGTAANLEGRSLSVARDAAVPAIYCEYLGAATCHPEGVEAYVQGCLNVMSELGMLDRAVPEDRIEHVVENPRPDSGHMQVCHPSPVTGYFETCVKLGDVVQSNDPLGTVYPLHAGPPVVINASHAGIVLVLRTFPRIRQGESAGVVMELPGPA